MGHSFAGFTLTSSLLYLFPSLSVFPVAPSPFCFNVCCITSLFPLTALHVCAFLFLLLTLLLLISNFSSIPRLISQKLQTRDDQHERADYNNKEGIHNFMSTPQELSPEDLASIEEKSRKLQPQLARRPEKEKLIEKNIMKKYPGDPKLHSVIQSLDKSKTEDKLNNFLTSRSSTDQLVDKNILRGEFFFSVLCPDVAIRQQIRGFSCMYCTFSFSFPLRIADHSHSPSSTPPNVQKTLLMELRSKWPPRLLCDRPTRRS